MVIDTAALRRAAAKASSAIGAFDARCLGLAFVVPLVEVFRRVSFALPSALAAVVDMRACLAALVAGVVGTAIVLLACALRGSGVRLRSKAACGTPLGVAGMLCLCGALAWGDVGAAVLAVAGYALVGSSLAALFTGWVEAYARRSPLMSIVYASLSVFLGNLLMPWLIRCTSPTLLAATLAICLLVSGTLLFALAHDKSAGRETPSEADADRRTPREVFLSSVSPAACGFMLIFFSWGVMAVPPQAYATDHSSAVYFVGNGLALVVAAWIVWSLRDNPCYEALRQRAFFLLPVFATFLAYFSFIRMLNDFGPLKNVLSVGYNASVAGFAALYVGMAAMRRREKGLPVEFSVAPLLTIGAGMYCLGAASYGVLGNTAMYVQIVITTLYILCLSFISAHRASLTDSGRVEKRCAELSEKHGLSSREREVLLLLASDYSVDRVAEELTISVETVRTHKKRIYAKLDVHKHEDLMRVLRGAE